MFVNANLQSQKSLTDKESKQLEMIPIKISSEYVCKRKFTKPKIFNWQGIQAIGDDTD